jgi:hypothetical protein
MKRCKKRQIEREKNKINKSDPIMAMYQKYCPIMKEFHKKGKGTLYDWMKTLEFDDLKELQETDSSTKKSAAIMYLAIIANTLQTGSNSFEDENPDTTDSTIFKMVNHFVFLATSASLEKAGLVEFKFEGEGFFNYQSDGFYSRLLSSDKSHV